MNLPDLPVRAVLGELAAALDDHGSAVLVAPPGTGTATVASARLAELLGSAPVITAHVRAFDVDVDYGPPARGERIETCVTRAVHSALSEVDGDVLAFLPGVGEISRASSLLADLSDVD